MNMRHISNKMIAICLVALLILVVMPKAKATPIFDLTKQLQALESGKNPGFRSRDDNDKPCEEFKQSIDFKNFIPKMGRILESATMTWGEYSPMNNTVVLTSSRGFLHCASVQKDGREIAMLVLGRSISLPNGLYSVYFAGTKQDFPKILINYLEGSGTKETLVYDISRADELIPGLLDYEKFLTGFNELNTAIFINEGFHANVQFPKWLGRPRSPWPDWDKQPSRDEIQPICYGPNPEVRAIFTKEYKAILAALKLSFAIPNDTLAKKAVQNFIQLRESRYKMLLQARVPSRTNTDGISCPEAEAIMELEEGVAKFVEAFTLIGAGLINHEQMITSLDSSGTNSSFYNFGLMQMAVLQHHFPDELKSITNQIATSSSWENGIFGQLLLKMR